MDLAKLILPGKPNHWKSETHCESSFEIDAAPVERKVSHKEPTLFDVCDDFVVDAIVVFRSIDPNGVKARRMYSWFDSVRVE